MLGGERGVESKEDIDTDDEYWKGFLTPDEEKEAEVREREAEGGKNASKIEAAVPQHHLQPQSPLRAQQLPQPPSAL